MKPKCKYPSFRKIYVKLECFHCKNHESNEACTLFIIEKKDILTVRCEMCFSCKYYIYPKIKYKLNRSKCTQMNILQKNEQIKLLQLYITMTSQH